MGILCALISVAVLLGIFKVYLKLTTKWDKSYTCLLGKTVIVTGANTGIGYYTALDLAKRGARVILACRDEIRAKEARKLITEATGNFNVEVKLLDLSSFASIRKFTDSIVASEKQLNILVNNAGVGGMGQTISEDGLDLLFQINYFGPVLLTILLLDLLKKSSNARIVNVSSAAAKWSQINVNELGQLPKGNFSESIHYANSKSALLHFTDKLAEILRKTNVNVNCLHPGVVKTEFFRKLPSYLKLVLDMTSTIFFKTPLEGAQTSIYVAVSKEAATISGQYFSNCAPEIQERDLYLRDQIWEKTEEILKINVSNKEL